MRRILLAMFWMLLSAGPTLAHESLPASLTLVEQAAGTYAVTWRVPATQGPPPAITPAFPSQCVVDASPSLTEEPGALVKRMVLRCGPEGLRQGQVTLAGLEYTALDALVRISFADGQTITRVLRPGETSLAAGEIGQRVDIQGYFLLGCVHILTGLDHLIFVLGLLLIVPNYWTLLKTVTAFTLAHSITLAIATLGYASVPVAFVNAMIALSILFLGPEIERRRRGDTSLTLRHPWAVAFLFGLLHGFGFASGLSALGLPQHDIPLALLLFNIGVEAGQLVFVALILSLARAFRILEIRWMPPLRLVPGYTVGVVGAFWTIQRLAILFGAGA